MKRCAVCIYRFCVGSNLVYNNCRRSARTLLLLFALPIDLLSLGGRRRQSLRHARRRVVAKPSAAIRGSQPGQGMLQTSWRRQQAASATRLSNPGCGVSGWSRQAFQYVMDLSGARGTASVRSIGSPYTDNFLWQFFWWQTRQYTSPRIKQVARDLCP